MNTRTGPGAFILLIFLISVSVITCGQNDTVRANSPTKLVQKAQDLMRVRDYTAARDVIQDALDSSPRFFPAHREMILLMERDDREAPRLRYRGLMEEHPNDPLYPLCLSLLTDEIVRRKELVERSLESDPTYSWALLEMARILDEMGSRDEAIDILQSAEFEGGSYEESRFLLAELLSRAGRLEESEEMYEELAVSASRGRLREKALEKKFSILWSTDMTRALSFAGEILAQSDSPLLLSDIGYELADSVATYERATEFFKKAVALSDTAHFRAAYPEAKPAWLLDRAAKSRGFYGEMLGELWYKLGDDERAIEALELARSEFSDPVKEILLTLARSYTRAGSPEWAVDVLFELLAKETDPGGRALLDSLYEDVYGSMEGLEERIAQEREKFFKAAPDFTLAGKGDVPVSLSSLKGKVVLLAFWFPT